MIYFIKIRKNYSYFLLYKFSIFRDEITRLIHSSIHRNVIIYVVGKMKVLNGHSRYSTLSRYMNIKEIVIGRYIMYIQDRIV